MKLNDLLKNHKVKVLGDNYLLKELEERSNQNAPEIILSIILISKSILAN